MIGYCEFFPSLAREGVLGMSGGFTSIHAQAVGYLGLDVQNTAPLSSGQFDPE